MSYKITKMIRRLLAIFIEPVVGYSRVVFAAKTMLLFFAVLLIAILIILTFNSDVKKKYRLTFQSVKPGAADNNSPEMLNPHLQGLYGDKHAYNITAKTATQETKEKINLKEIIANIDVENNGWIAVEASGGEFFIKDSILNLKDNIRITNNDGYDLITDYIHADVKNDLIEGNNKISGKGPLGTIDADSFYITNKGKNIKLEGNVKVIFNQQPGGE